MSRGIYLTMTPGPIETSPVGARLYITTRAVGGRLICRRALLPIVSVRGAFSYCDRQIAMCFSSCSVVDRLNLGTSFKIKVKKKSKYLLKSVTTFF